MEFYGQLRQQSTKAEALRQAQLALIEGNVRIEGDQLIWSGGTVPLPPELQGLGDWNLSHPFFWAAFTMVGSRGDGVRF